MKSNLLPKKPVKKTMMKILLTVSAVWFFMVTEAQTPGIHFEHGLDWTAVQAKAKKENKYIFVYCYTALCKDCNAMAANVFFLKEAGDAVNPNFIAVNMQMEMAESDPGMVQSAYEDARTMMSKYGIHAFPTFLFFTPDGKLVHRATGVGGVATFTGYVHDAQEPAKQYYSMMNQYDQGRRDTLLLESLAISAFQNGNRGLGDSVLGELLPRIKNPFTKSRLDLIGQSVKKPEDTGFELFLHNADKINKLERPDFAETIVRNAIMRQNPLIVDLFNDHSPKQNWDKIYNDLNAKYGAACAQRVIVWIKVPYYKSQGNWELYVKSLLIYLKEYDDYILVEEMNNYAWDIFKYSSSAEDLAFGLSYSLRSLTATEKLNPAFIDTYANLLYKSGKIETAIAKETEAIKLADASDKQFYKDMLGRMKAGQKTWE